MIANCSSTAVEDRAILAELPLPPPCGAPSSYRKEKETHEFIFSWLSWLAVLLVGAPLYTLYTSFYGIEQGPKSQVKPQVERVQWFYKNVLYISAPSKRLLCFHFNKSGRSQTRINEKIQGNIVHMKLFQLESQIKNRQRFCFFAKTTAKTNRERFWDKF